MVKNKVKILAMLIFLVFCINSTIVYASGERTNPYNSWTNHQFILQQYSFQTPRTIQLKLLELHRGDQAYSLLKSESIYNGIPAADEEWLLMKFNMKYVSGPKEAVHANDIISSYSGFYTKSGEAISNLGYAYFGNKLKGLGEYDVSFYPGGELVVWYAMLVKKYVGYPLIKIGIGYDIYNYPLYPTIYSWFTTDPNHQEASTVMYDKNGSTGGIEPKDNKKYENTSQVTVLGNNGSLIKTNYIFAGWNTKANGLGTNYSTGAKFAIGTANITLYAKWLPIAPASVKAISSSYNSINISWSGVIGATGYEIYRSTSSTGTYVSIAATTAKYYNNTGLTTNSTYYYKVKAYGTVETEKVYSSYSTVVSAKLIPSTPINFKASRISSKIVKLTWSGVTGANGYEVYRSTSSTGLYTLLTTTNLYNTNSSLTTGKIYYYKLRSYRTVGATKVYSNWTAVVSAKP